MHNMLRDVRGEGHLVEEAAPFDRGTAPGAAQHRNLAVITGYTGSVGDAYARALQHRGHDTDIVGLSRRPNPSPVFEGMSVIGGVDLLSSDTVEAAIRTLRLERYANIVLIHPVGTFKWEDPPPDIEQGQFDPEVYASNVMTFMHVFDAILCQLKDRYKEFLGRIAVTPVMFASISDRWKVPFWASYSHANEETRKLIRRAIKDNPEIPIHGVSLDLGTINVQSEQHLRPNADRAYWLGVDDLVKRSMPFILPPDRGPLTAGSTFSTVEIYEPKPGFDPETYYTDLEGLRVAWQRQMGVEVD